MKIDESVIDKVLDNKAAPGEARKVAGWFVTEEGRKYLSGRLDRIKVSEQGIIKCSVIF